MNCTRCDAPLEPNVRFCRNCGLPVSAPASSDGAAARPSPLPQPTPMNNAPTILPTPQPTSMNNAPTILPTRLEIPQPAQSPQPWSQAQPQSVPAQSPQPWSQAQPQSMPPQSQQPWSQAQQGYVPPTQAAPQSQYQYHQPAQSPPGGPGTYVSDGAEKLSPPPRARSHRLRGCLLAGLSGLAVLILLAAAAWPLIVRPNLNGLVKDQLNTVLADAVNQVPEGVSVAVSPGHHVLTEDFLNNLIVLKSSSSDPVQNMHLSIRPDLMRLEFQVYGF